MTFQINGSDVADIIEVVTIVGTIIAMLVGGLVFYLLVRPPKKARVERRPDPEALDAEEVIQVLDRMEQRLEVLERAMIAAEAPRQRQLLNAGEESPENRRNK